MENNKLNISLSMLIIGIGILLIPTSIILAPTIYRKIILPIKYSSINEWMPLIEKYSKYYNIDPYFVASVVKQESGGNPNAISSAGAIGLMQIMPSTGLGVCGFTVNDLRNPEKNIQCGIKYMSDTYKKYGDYRSVASVYYSGNPDWTRSVGKPPVYQYVSEVIAKYNEIKALVA